VARMEANATRPNGEQCHTHERLRPRPTYMGGPEPAGSPELGNNPRRSITVGVTSKPPLTFFRRYNTKHRERVPQMFASTAAPVVASSSGCHFMLHSSEQRNAIVAQATTYRPSACCTSGFRASCCDHGSDSPGTRSKGSGHSIVQAAVQYNNLRTGGVPGAASAHTELDTACGFKRSAVRSSVAEERHTGCPQPYRGSPAPTPCCPPPAGSRCMHRALRLPRARRAG
jgi:hypothetical protein